MKKLYYFLIIILLFLGGEVFAQVKVKGYYRKNGTYVSPHYRSSPNHTKTDNYSYPGNTNPYTGKVASGGATQKYNTSSSSINVKNMTFINSKSQKERVYTKTYELKYYSQLTYSDDNLCSFMLYNPTDSTSYEGRLTVFSDGTEIWYDSDGNKISENNPTQTDLCGYHNGEKLYKGPRGGCYYLNSNGNKTYVDRGECDCL